MEIKTPEGVLTITDTELTFEPFDNNPTVRQSLDPMPDHHYERGIAGVGTLVLGDHTFTLSNDQAPDVISELRRERSDAGGRTDNSEPIKKSDYDTVTADHAHTVTTPDASE